MCSIQTCLLLSAVMVTIVFADKCLLCNLVAETLQVGLDKTKNQHFAGGNTYWEEKKLGKFITSETRLLEAMEYVCKKKYVQNWDKYKDIKNLEFKCMQLVEESEDNIENWYFHKQSSDPDILLWLCHGKLRLCCSEGHYGAECSPCPGVKQNVSVCSDHGSCQGDGSREGTGKCVCHKGYVGFMCSNCDANYYAVPNISVFTCNECHQSCKGGCFNSGPENCKECHTGWIMSDNHKCEDINECESENRCSGKHMKCHNLEGSYECVCEEGFVIDSKGNCKINVEASAEEMWIPPSRLLRSFSISSFCILISLVIWRRSLSLSIFATICALIILLIEFYFDHTHDVINANEVEDGSHSGSENSNINSITKKAQSMSEDPSNVLTVKEEENLPGRDQISRIDEL